MVLKEELSKLGHERLCPAAVFVKDGKVLCGLRHYTPDKWKTISVWTCPGGRCDKNETIHDTLMREVAEEVGITDFEVLEYIGEVKGAKEGDVVSLFFCETLQSPKLMEPDKFSEWKWFSPKDLPNNYINKDFRKLVLEFLSNKNLF